MATILHLTFLSLAVGESNFGHVYYISEPTNMNFGKHSRLNETDSEKDTLGNLLEKHKRREEIDTLVGVLTKNANRLTQLQKLFDEEEKMLQKSVLYNAELKKNMRLVESKLSSLFRQKQNLEEKYLQLNKLLQKYEDQEFSLNSETSVLSDVRTRSLQGQIAFHKIELRKIQDKIYEYRSKCLRLTGRKDFIAFLSSRKLLEVEEKKSIPFIGALLGFSLLLNFLGAAAVSSGYFASVGESLVLRSSGIQGTNSNNQASLQSKSGPLKKYPDEILMRLQTFQDEYELSEHEMDFVVNMIIHGQDQNLAN